MRLNKRIRIIVKNMSKKDIGYFKKDLRSFKSLISKMMKTNPKASISDCIESYNNSLEELILKTNNIRSGEIFRYIALEALLGEKNYNEIVKRLNDENNIEDVNLIFTGNLQNDYKSLVKTFFYSEYGLKHKELCKMLELNPSDTKIKSKIKELEEVARKIRDDKLSPYDTSKIQKEQKEFFEKLRKKEKSRLSSILSDNIILKIKFLRELGALDNYEEEHNHNLDKLFMPSSFKVRDKDSFEEELLDKSKLMNYSIHELIALNTFWTNRLAKEVEKKNQVIYVLENTNTFYNFSQGKEFEIIDEDIMYYLAEYRALVPYITNFKLKVKNSGRGEKKDNSSNLYSVSYDITNIFSREEIEYYGYRELDGMFYNVLLLNNRSQLLYDQKDIAIEEMLSFMVNTSMYINSGVALEEENKSSKSLIAIDLKGFNAPLMIHIDKDQLVRAIKRVSDKTEISVYRGEKDNIIESLDGEYIVATNILFKLNSVQRKDILARANIVGPRDTNARYVTHISWMLNPKKDMPKLIYEPRRILDLETGKLDEIQEDIGRKK